jgi:pimeloyl-ACP methyl ester carboxylesterase
MIELHRVPEFAYTDGFVDVNGIRLHYVDYGGLGEPLVALPGLIQSAHAFDPVASLLAPHMRVLALDFRGRGQSDWGPPERYRIDQYLRDLRGFLAALQIERCSLIGTSLGGFVARLFATAHPERVTRLVLNDCAIGGTVAGVHKVSSRPALAPADFADLDEVVAWFFSDRPGLARLDRFTQRTWASHYVTAGENGRLRFRCDPAVIRLAESMAKQFAALPRTSVEAELAWEHAKRLTMPLLIVRGSLSEVIATETVNRLTEVLPNARCVEIAGVSHSPTLYEEEARAALAEFFQVPMEHSLEAHAHSA